MVNAAAPDLVFIHLRLGPFPAIHQKKMIVQRDHLGGGMPVEGRDGRIVSEDGYCEHIVVLNMTNWVVRTPFSIYQVKNNTKSNRNGI